METRWETKVEERAHQSQSGVITSQQVNVDQRQRELATLSYSRQTCVIVRLQQAADALGCPVSNRSARINPVTGDTNSFVIASGNQSPLPPGAGVFTLEDCV